MFRTELCRFLASQAAIWYGKHLHISYHILRWLIVILLLPYILSGQIFGQDSRPARRMTNYQKQPSTKMSTRRSGHFQVIVVKAFEYFEYIDTSLTGLSNRQANHSDCFCMSCSKFLVCSCSNPGPNSLMSAKSPHIDTNAYLGWMEISVNLKVNNSITTSWLLQLPFIVPGCSTEPLPWQG